MPGKAPTAVESFIQENDIGGDPMVTEQNSDRRRPSTKSGGSLNGVISGGAENGL